MIDKIKREVYSWTLVIIVVLVLRAIFVEAYVIPTGSMETTLLIGDALLVNRFVYGVKFPYTQLQIIPVRMPKRGDIIVFKYPFENRDFVKRCIAIEGDTVRIVNKVLYVNGMQVNEPYKIHRDYRVLPGYENNSPNYQKNWENAKFADLYGIYVRDNFGPVVVPKDCVFAMGDNRDNSMDSRFWGPLHKKYLKGKPLFIYFSFDPGHEASSIFDILQIWKWREIRFKRIGRIV
ncbi:MAG: signal peptidase I [candidate division WOR-3 bacterium]